MTDASRPPCRFCCAPLDLNLVDLGRTPLANSYLSAEQLARPEPRYPLHARVCRDCRLAQVDAVATPDEIFSHYAYFSSVASSWVEHARRFTEMARQRWALGAASKVVEIASNDGYLLRHFRDAGVPILGVEPAANVADAARALGIPTVVEFFGVACAEQLCAEGHSADLIVGNNVLAHVPDIRGFVTGMATLLKPEGVVSVEFPHLLRLIDQVQFDTIYHEHFSYLSLLAVERIFGDCGLRVFDVQELPTHGGSLRVMACGMASKAHPTGATVQNLRQAETLAGLDRDRGYADFETRVRAVREALLAFLRKARDEGRTVVAYGAAAKGNTLLNYCGIGSDLIAYAVDKSPHKQGLYLPGSHLPIFAPERLRETKPDYVLILPWNLRDEITTEMSHIRTWGGRFVVAIPATRILE